MNRKIILVVLLSIFLSACNKGSAVKATPTPDARRQLINDLDYSKRPFVAVFPHSSNKLLTLYVDNIAPEFKNLILDLEYLSGNALKGGRTSIGFPTSMPFTQAFLLGSCSSGGRCSFDTDLISGNLKNRLETDSQTDIHILKSDFVFVTKGQAITSDSRVSYQPSDKVVNQIIQNTQGLPKAIDGQLAYPPIAITSVSNKKVTGQLSFRVSGIKTVMIYDGNSFQSLKADISSDEVKVNLTQTPWSKTVQIIRDDLKGASETQDLFLVGPIVLLK